MGIELIDNERPAGFFIGVDESLDPRSEVGFGARWIEPRLNDSPCGYLEGGEQTQRTVALVFELAALDKSGNSSFDQALQGLNTGLFIDTEQMLAPFMAFDGLAIVLAYRTNLLLELYRIVNPWLEPVAALMRFEVGFFLKSDLHCVGRSSRQYRV